MKEEGFDVQSDIDSYDKNGYDLYLNEDNVWMCIEMDNDAEISKVDLTYHIDISDTKENNLEQTNEMFKKVSNILLHTSAPVKNNIKQPIELSDTFVEKFKNTSYYESFFENFENGYIGYHTDSEEEYDEYSKSYISLHLRNY